jgi:methyl-accepting chemotaxis protein-1 (serine sensor receptor)
MNWIANSIRNKILAVFALGLVVVIGSALYGFSSARHGLAELERVNKTLVAHADEVQDLETDFKEQVQEWKNVLLRGFDAKLLERYWNAFVKKEESVRNGAKRLSQVAQHSEAKDLLGKFVAAHEEMGQRYRQGLETFKGAEFDPKKGDASVRGIDRVPAELLEKSAKLIRDEAARTLTEAQTGAQRRLDMSLAIIAAFSAVAIVLCGWLLVTIVVRPLVEAARVADMVAGGDLTVRIAAPSRDEAGRLLSALGRMRDGLAEAVAAIRQAAESVGSGTKQIAAGNAELSSRTEEQASSLEETASSMEELTTTVKQNAENAKQANQLAIGASEVAGQGGNVMGEVVTTMSGISEASRKIADIIGVIDGIAFQTNILALNAAVEAARAGEQGRGFAVVASEVRSLAQRSAAAAKEIKDLIQNSVERVQGGTRLVEGAGKTMEEIVTSVKRVTDIMSEIAAASQEQLSGIEQVGNAVMQMDRVTQQNAALVEESAAAAENMSEQAEQLVQAVSRFKLNGMQDIATQKPIEAKMAPVHHLQAADEHATPRPERRRAAAVRSKSATAAPMMSLATAKPRGAAGADGKEF